MKNNKPKLVLKSKNNDNVLESVIEVQNITNEVTVEKIVDHFEFTKKKLVEAEAQIEANNVSDKSVSEMECIKNLPEDEKDREIIIQYLARAKNTQQLEDLVVAANKTLDQYREYFVQIEEDMDIPLKEYLKDE